MKPMLAANITSQEKLVFPLIGTPKIDGIRCITLDLPRPLEYRCVPVSRTLKCIRNEHIFDVLSRVAVPGLDGEIICSDKFCETSSSVMNSKGTPDFQYLVFDYGGDWRDVRWTKGLFTKYSERIAQLQLVAKDLHECIKILPTTTVKNLAELNQYYDECVAEGYEGACFRAPHSAYKFGRSTEKEGWLLKMKGTEDAEGLVFGFTCLQHNENEHKPGDIHNRRSQKQEGLVPMDTLGALLVAYNGRTFSLGSGFDAAQRKEIWKNQDKYIGTIVKFKYQPHGTKDNPRSPIFLGFRDSEDL